MYTIKNEQGKFYEEDIPKDKPKGKKIYDPLKKRYRYFIFEGNGGRFVDDY